MTTNQTVPSVGPNQQKVPVTETYSVHKVITRAELDALVEVSWTAWTSPYIPIHRLAFPIFGYTAVDRARDLAASKDRLWANFERQRSDDKYWLCAKCDSTGQIVGGVQLEFVQGSPFPNGCPKVDLYWWPEGEEVREFAEEMMRQVYTPRSVWMQRPHGGMSNLVVLPEHRGRGVGSMLMQWNNEELDRRGIEGFVEASDTGRGTYEKAGYQVVMRGGSYLPSGKSENWRRFYHEIALQPFLAMWRPRFGRIEPGERTMPWQQGPSLPIK